MKAEEIAEKYAQNRADFSPIEKVRVERALLGKAYLDLLAKYQALEKAARDYVISRKARGEHQKELDWDLFESLQKQLTPDGARND